MTKHEQEVKSLESMDKPQLECEKLRREIRALSSPLRHAPSLWISTLTAILAVFATFQQYRLSKYESLLAEAKAVQAKNAQAAAETAADLATGSLATLEERLATGQRRLEELDIELTAKNAEVATAYSLIKKLKPTAPDALKADIQGFEKLQALTWEEKLKLYDPTGKHPYHVPMEK